MVDPNQVIKDYIIQNKEQLNRDAFANDPSLATIYSEVAGPFQPENYPSVQTYDNNGDLVSTVVPEPPVRPSDLYPGSGPLSDQSDQNVKNKNDKSVRNTGTRSVRDPDQDTQPVVTNRETMALIQKGYYQRPSFYGDQSLRNNSVAFSRGVNTCMSFSSLGNVLKSSTGNRSIARNKTTNYYLLDNEKIQLQNKANQLASAGIVPYDVLEEFLYIIVSVDNFDDLNYIATVTGVDELGNPNLIREPVLILSIVSLDKVAYLANAVAAVNKKYDPKFSSAYSAENTSDSMFSSLLTSTSLAAIPQFPGISILTSSISSIISSVASQVGTMALFNTISGLSGAAFNTAFNTIMSSIGGLASSFLSIGSEISNLARSVISMGINAVGSIVNSLLDISGTINKLANTMNQVAAFVTKPRLPSMMSDINGSFASMFSTATNILSSLNSISSLVGAIAGPTISGFAVSQLINRNPGRMIGPFVSQLVIGQKVPISVATNNPMLQPPSYVGKAFFGESPVSIAAVDQTFVRRVGPFSSPSSGAGALSFQLQNFGSFGGSLPISSIVSQLSLGTITVPVIGPMATYVNQLTTNVCNILNVPTTSPIEMRRSDNTIPFMIAMGSALVNDTKSPFSSSVYTDGWKNASSVGNDLQRHNKAFLNACTAL